MKPTRLLRSLLLGSTLFAAVSTATVHAQTWTGGGADANWTTAGNWTGGTPSTATDGTSTVTFYDTGATQLTNSTGGRYNLNQIAFNSGATSPVTINVTASPTSFDSGTAIRFNAGTNISVAAGDHKIVGTGVNNGTAYDVIFNGAAGSTHTFDIASGASFEINARIHRGSVTDNKTYAKTGGGTLILSGFNGGGGAWAINSSKAFQIQQGAVRFAQANATGNSQNNYVVSSGAAFEIAGVSLQLNNGNVTLNGTGISSGGALRSISGNSILQGNNTTGTIVLASNSSIGVDADSTFTIKKVISGSGALTKVGAGTLVLDGTLQGTGGAFDNTYTGATTVTAGTLEVRGSIASSSGITNNAALVFNSDSAQSYGNTISGSGTLTKQGSGTLTLSANNSYSGATTVSAGILQIGNGGTSGTLGSNSDTLIASGAELRIDRSTDSFGYSYSGELSGSGTVNILASRRFNFQNNNQTASGDLSFVVDGILAINTGSDVTAVHLGDLSGAGTIQRAGTAPTSPPVTLLTIGGKNTSSTFSGNITNIAEFGLDKVGTGTLTLGGSYGHGSGTTVTAGTLLLNGNMTSTANAVTVGANGTLGGNGSIAGTLEVSGTLAPGGIGTDIQTLNAGTTTWNGGATFNFDLSSTNTDSDKLNITGDFTKGGAGSFVFDFTGSTPQWNTTFTLVEWSNDNTGFVLADFDYTGLVGEFATESFFILNNNSLQFTAIPEPTTALAGILLGLGLLRRRR